MIEAKIKITDEFVSELVSRLDVAMRYYLDVTVGNIHEISAIDDDDVSNIFSDVVKTLVDEVNDKVMS